LLAGCPANNRIADDDPLIGGQAPTPPAPVPAASPSAAAPVPAGGVPPLPPASAATTTASLPAGDLKPDERALTITDGRGGPAKNSWDGPAKPADKDAAGTTLGTIQPIANVSRESMDPVHGMTQADGAKAELGPNGPPDSYQQLQAELTRRGMNWYRQEKKGDGVKFVCTIPKQNDPTRALTYEATDHDEIAVLKAVLAKIDQGP
jgi:hypothetical protein